MTANGTANGHPVLRWVLVEHHGSAAARSVVEDVDVLEMTAPEAAEMNKRIVRTPCRVYPAEWFT